MAAPYSNKALPAGSVLREWRLEEVLGVGGFGIVYKGRGLYFNELVAIKEYFPGAISDRVDDTTVVPNDSDSEELYAFGLSKFLEEAKVLWNLSKPDRHPNIVSVRSLFEVHGTAYMVMDFEGGVSLSKHLKDGRRFDEAALLGLIRPVAEGLDRAHRAGVLHRDIKPANILIDETGKPVLIDFGSARFDSGQATSTKVTFYTPPYAALEQYVKTYPQGPWTDIYALGVTLYECVAGKKPAEVLERLHGELDEPLSRKEWPGFSPAFLKAVDAAMAIKPSDRPQSIGQWLRMFDPVVDAGDEAMTVISTFREEPTRIAPTPKPPQAPEPSPPGVAPPVTAEPPGGSARRSARVMAIGGGALVVALALAGVALVMKPDDRSTASAKAGGQAAATPALGAGQRGGGAVDALGALIAEAEQTGRPAKEIAALNAGRVRLVDLSDQIASLGATATAAETVAPLRDEAEQLGKRLAKAEADALAAEAQGLVRDVRANAAWTSGTGPAGAARQSKAALDAGLARIGAAAEAGQALDAVRAALPLHKAFTSAFAGAQAALVSAERASFTAAEAAARQLGAELLAEAAKPKPWVLASKSQKERYRVAQENGAAAQARMAELTELAGKAAGSASLKTLVVARDRASAVRKELESLKAAQPPS